MPSRHIAPFPVKVQTPAALGRRVSSGSVCSLCSAGTPVGVAHASDAPIARSLAGRKREM